MLLHKFMLMNLFFVIEDKLITPPLGDTVLDGVTRDSIIRLSKKLNIKIEVRKISVEEIILALKNGSINEAFGASVPEASVGSYPGAALPVVE